MADDPESTGPQQGRFQPGQSGNPAGRPKGSVNRATRLVQLLLGRNAGALARKAVELALGGDSVALKLCFERLWPVPKSARFVEIELPKIETPAHLVAAAAALTEAVAQGKIAMEDVGPLTGLIEATAEAIRINDHDERIAALERFAEDRRLRAVG